MKFQILILITLTLLICKSIYGQESHSSNSSKVIGSEIKGMYIGGGVSAFTGGLYGSWINAMDSGNRSLYGLNTAGLLYTPGSLIGLGIGSGLAEIFGWEHTDFNKSFQLGVGLSSAQNYFRQDQNKINKRTFKIGYNIRVLSPEIESWRYSINASYFNVQIEDDQKNHSWLEFSLDLQYIIPLNEKTSIYPFIGSSLRYETELKAGRSQINWDSNFDFNLGIGTFYSISNHWNIFVEFKSAMDTDLFNSSEQRDRIIVTVGVHYFL